MAEVVLNGRDLARVSLLPGQLQALLVERPRRLVLVERARHIPEATERDGHRHRIAKLAAEWERLFVVAAGCAPPASPALDVTKLGQCSVQGMGIVLLTGDRQALLAVRQGRWQ